jgi:hypothetical protein
MMEFINGLCWFLIIVAVLSSIKRDFDKLK